MEHGFAALVPEASVAEPNIGVDERRTGPKYNDLGRAGVYCRQGLPYSHCHLWLVPKGPEERPENISTGKF